VTNPIDSDDGTCSGCGALDGVQSQPAPPEVQAWSCTACGLDFACTAVNPHLRIALSIVALLPTPQLRTTALLDVMRAKVTRRSGMTDTPCRSAAHRRGGLAH
jgi:hypothetical protein